MVLTQPSTPGANLTLRVGDVDVYASPHFREYSYDKNRSNYSKPMPVRANGVTIKIDGDDAIQFIFDNNDRGVLLQMPIRINITCAPAPCVQTAVPEGPCDILAKAGSPCVTAWAGLFSCRQCHAFERSDHAPTLPTLRMQQQPVFQCSSLSTLDPGSGR